VKRAFVKQFIKETREAYFSFDEERIRATLKKYKIKPPEDSKALMRSTCKMILAIKDAPADKVAIAKSWLRENGKPEDIDGNV
jgi:hypothetical protein